ncbi:MAG: suppressor of fused domain protein [Polyangia bacterium]
MTIEKLALPAGLVVLAIIAWAVLRQKPTPSVAPASTASASSPSLSPGATGRAGIDAALDVLYPKEHDHRFGMHAAAGESTPPLEEVVVYRSQVPTPHWHYVTYGLSELGTKVSDDPAHSGFGIELTLRLLDDSDTPPIWPINLLRWLAGTVQRDKNPFGDGHSMPLVPDMLDTVSRGTEGVAFAVDSKLGTVKTANGEVKFLQVVPLTIDEYALMGRWDAMKLFDEMRAIEPGLLWRVSRKSILHGVRGPEIEQRAKADGSSQAVDFDNVSWDEHMILLDALNRHVVTKFLRYRVAYGRDASIHSEDGKVLDLRVGPVALKLDKDRASLSVPAARAAALADQLAHAASNTIVKFDGRPLFRLGKMERLDPRFQK